MRSGNSRVLGGQQDGRSFHTPALHVLFCREKWQLNVLLHGRGAAADTGPHVLLGPQPVVVGDFLLNVPWLSPDSGVWAIKGYLMYGAF